MISIIVPVYNVENELGRCVDSILKQTYKNIEIILVDDGSTDSSSMICDQYAKIDDRIQVIHKENGGLSDARNTGIKSSSGEYLLFVDSDDYIEEDSCDQLLKACVNVDVDIVVGACREVNKDRVSYQAHTNLIPKKRYNLSEFIIASIKAGEWYAPTWLNLYKRKLFEDNNIWFKKGIYFEDVEIQPKLFLNASSVVYIDYPFYNYIIRENSIMTSSNLSKKRTDSINICKEWKIACDRIKDFNLRRYLYGHLVKMYIHVCREYKNYTWDIPGVNFSFAWKYALSKKDALKALAFKCFPKIYCKAWK